MKTDNIQISFKPTSDEKSSIEQWLRDERDQSGEGFYIKWDSINDYYSTGKFVTISFNNHPVGFATWSSPYPGYIARINFFEIHPDERKKGYGKRLLSELLHFFYSKNFYAVDLQCINRSSEIFWRKMHFVDLPEFEGNDQSSSPWLYKLLIQPLKFSDNAIEPESLELWEGEPNVVKEHDPKWVWNISFKPNTRKLSQPIVQPCHYEWRIRRRKNNRIIEDTMVKKLDSYIFSLGSFMIIEELP